jgi:hypothetical protein
MKGRHLISMQVRLNAHFASSGSARGALFKNAN